MTPSYPTPTWGDIDRFCKVDDWEPSGTTDHVHWEKVLPTGEVLSTHRSLAANKVIKPGIFGVILREQLKVSKDEFWRAINSGEPVDRPVELDDPQPAYPAWVVLGLQKAGVPLQEIESMTPEEGEALLLEKWSAQT